MPLARLAAFLAIAVAADATERFFNSPRINAFANIVADMDSPTKKSQAISGLNKFAEGANKMSGDKYTNGFELLSLTDFITLHHSCLEVRNHSMNFPQDYQEQMNSKNVSFLFQRLQSEIEPRLDKMVKAFFDNDMPSTALAWYMELGTHWGNIDQTHLANMSALLRSVFQTICNEQMDDKMARKVGDLFREIAKILGPKQTEKASVFVTVMKCLIAERGFSALPCIGELHLKYDPEILSGETLKPVFEPFLSSEASAPEETAAPATTPMSMSKGFEAVVQWMDEAGVFADVNYPSVAALFYQDSTFGSIIHHHHGDLAAIHPLVYSFYKYSGLAKRSGETIYAVLHEHFRHDRQGTTEEQMKTCLEGMPADKVREFLGVLGTKETEKKKLMEDVLPKAETATA